MRGSGHIVFAIAAMVSLCLLAGCKNQEMKPSGDGQARAAAKATQNPLQMTLATDPQKLIEQKPYTVRVHVADQAGKPVPDAALHGVLTMTLMDHGRQEMDLIGKGNGDYEAATTPEMAGAWEFKVTAKRGTDLNVQTFPIRVDEK